MSYIIESDIYRVFILHDEGNNVLGVYKSEDAANSAKALILSEGHVYMFVQEYDID